MQPVLLFQLLGYFLAPAVLEAVGNLPAPAVHAQGHDVDVVAVDVCMLKNQERLVAVAQLLHVLPADGGKLPVGQYIVGMRIERDVDDRLLGAVVRGKPCRESLHRFAHAEMPVLRVWKQVGIQYLRVPFLYLRLVVCQRAIQVLTRADFRHHAF